MHICDVWACARTEARTHTHTRAHTHTQHSNPSHKHGQCMLIADFFPLEHNKLNQHRILYLFTNKI